MPSIIGIIIGINTIKAISSRNSKIRNLHELLFIFYLQSSGHGKSSYFSRGIFSVLNGHKTNLPFLFL